MLIPLIRKYENVPVKLFLLLLFVQAEGRITNTEVQEICKVSKRSASNYLTELGKEFLDKKGETGKGTYYTLKEQ